MVLVKLQISGNHQEEMALYIMKSPHISVVFGRPWFVHHIPQVDWAQGTITGWSPSCHAFCFQFTSSLPTSSLPVQEVPPDLSSVPSEYHDLGQVFSKTQANFLSLHWSYNCAIDLHPGTTPSRCRLFALSAPETRAMEKYIRESLAASLLPAPGFSS